MVGSIPTASIQKNRMRFAAGAKNRQYGGLEDGIYE